MCAVSLRLGISWLSVMTTTAPHPVQRSSSLRHPLHTLGEETHTLLEIERAGDEAGAPLIAIAMVACLIVPILALMMVLAFGAAALFG
jgi:hypothetical protein